MEPGHNLGGDVDSFRRFIYIHGTPDSEPMGAPASHGCIRMRNADIIRVFDQVPVGAAVTITE
jgi:lipoprotein-anchoring transpeptidase ErfK/SrfK